MHHILGHARLVCRCETDFVPQLYEVGSQIAESSVSRLKPENARRLENPMTMHASTSAPSTSPPFFPSHMSLFSTI